MRRSRVRLVTIFVTLAALALFQTPGAVDEAAATPAAGEYTLVRNVKTANFPQMSGIALIPNATNEAVVITQDGYLWRVSLSSSFAPVAFGDMSHCPDANDNDGDGRINDGCPASGAAEAGSNCTNATDNDGDGFINDGCGAFDPPETCGDALDNEGDGYFNDGCPTDAPETGAQCLNNVNDDVDNLINDGCPANGPAESGSGCANAVDDDGDTLVNDGCPTGSEAALNPDPPYECADADDDDGDTLVNDGCPTVVPTERKLLLGAEEGLVGIAFSPNYATDGRLYLYYTTPENSPPDPTNYCCRDRLSRFQVTNNTLVNSSEVLLIDTHDREPWHVGGQLAFGPDGYLYIARGDEGWVGDLYGNAQSKTVLYGKILRINVTGQSSYTIPPGNPFADGPGGDADEIWAYGFRNPWRFSFDTATGDLWAGDVGQYNWEEVDKVVAGGNYGWDIVEGNHCYESCTPPPGHVPPRAEYCHPQWTSSCPGYNAAGDCAIIGGFVYHGAAMPELDGWYVYGDYCTGKIWALDAASASSPPVLLTDSAYNLSSFFARPDGELIVLTYNNAIYRLAPDSDDDDGDGLLDVDEGECGGYVDNDGNGLINDGCPAVGAPEIEQCHDAVDHDGDGTVNDGCPAVGVREADGSANGGPNCAGAVDNDGDGFVNDGCPAVIAAEIGQCSTRQDGSPNDNDNDGWINDGCPGFTEVTACGSDHLDAASVPERVDTPGDDDGDGLTNEPLPPGAEAYDCYGSPTPTPTASPTPAPTASPTPTPSPTPAPTPSPTPTPPPPSVMVNVGDNWFCNPSYEGGVCPTSIWTGDTVTWNWVGNLPHTTTACSDANFNNCAAAQGWDSGIMTDGTFPHTFNSAGTFYYRCDIHPQMRGRIDVIQDTDGDGWSDAAESIIGTNPSAACGTNAWPADINSSGFVDTGDLGMLTNDFGDAVPGAAPARHNIAPDIPDGFIDTGDIGRLTNLFGKGCGP